MINLNYYIKTSHMGRLLNKIFPVLLTFSLVCDLGVYLCRSRVFVAKQCLYGRQLGAVVKCESCERMAQNVWTDSLFDSCPLRYKCNFPLNSTAGQPAEWPSLGHEQCRFLV